MTRRLTLRSTLVAITAAGAAIALAIAATLVVLTSYLRDRGDELVDAVESVRLAEEAELRALLIRRAEDPLLRARLAGELRQTLTAAADHVETPRERQVFEEVVARAEAYLAAFDGAPDLIGVHEERAIEAMEALVAINMEQAREVRARMVRSDRIGNAIGIGAGILLLAGMATVIVWLRRRAFQPLVRFLGGVAHDLRNPIAAMKLGVATMPPDRPLPAEPRLRRQLAMFDRQLDRLDRMVGDLLDLARAESGRLELRPEPVELAALVRDAVEPFATASPRHRLAVSAPEPVVTRADAGRIEQVVGNLVSNAIKYTPAGGDIAVRVGRAGRDAVVEVQDPGIGLTDEEQRRLFTAFDRLEGGRVAGGTGLGLYVTRRIVEAHGGRIEVASRRGAGTTFRVLLPAV